MKKFENYSDTLNWMFEQLPMYQRKGEIAFKKDLTNIRLLCHHLKNPQDKFPTIHIAGTNGKGSISHILASMLQSNGLRVGMYTSPHYIDFRERIKINGDYISQENVIGFVNKNMNAILNINPSFFEITVAMAFDYFNTQQVDVAIIETGLGGRLDSTNIITPILSIISNISFDHMNMLGGTLELIAKEKAGIIKMNTPVIIGEHQNETDFVFTQQAETFESDIIFAQDTFKVDYISTNDLSEYKIFAKSENDSFVFKTDVHGPFQSRNLITAITAYHQIVLSNLGELNLSFKVGLLGLKNVTLSTEFIGRWMVLKNHPKIIGDSAHNLAGLLIVLKELNKQKYDNIHFVLGMVNDKDIDKLLSLFPKNGFYYFSSPNIPRGLNKNKLRNQAAKKGLKGDAYDNLEEAFNTALRHANYNDLVFFGGSTFVVAEILSRIRMGNIKL